MTCSHFDILPQAPVVARDLEGTPGRPMRAGASQFWGLLPAAWHLCRFLGPPLQPRSCRDLLRDRIETQSQQTGFSKNDTPGHGHSKTILEPK